MKLLFVFCLTFLVVFLFLRFFLWIISLGFSAMGKKLPYVKQISIGFALIALFFAIWAILGRDSRVASIPVAGKIEGAQLANGDDSSELQSEDIVPGKCVMVNIPSPKGAIKGTFLIAAGEKANEVLLKRIGPKATPPGNVIRVTDPNLLDYADTLGAIPTNMLKKGRSIRCPGS